MARRYIKDQYDEDKRIVKYIETNAVNLIDPCADINSKKYVLETICKYHGLRIDSDESGSPFCLISQSTDKKISSSVRDRYNRAKRRLKEYNEGKRKITSLESEVEQLSLFR